ncbi:hypothetical protein J6P68_00575 [bacterium]|nr:hypothetical protein [bacterium]
MSYELNINELTTSTNTLKASIQLVGISTPITASYTINYSQISINSSTIYYGNNGTLSINESSFDSLIHTPYYF